MRISYLTKNGSDCAFEWQPHRSSEWRPNISPPDNFPLSLHPFFPFTWPEMSFDDLPKDAGVAGRATEMVRESNAKRAEDGEKRVVSGRGKGIGGEIGVERSEADAEQNGGANQRARETVAGGKHARRRVAAQRVHVNLNEKERREIKKRSKSE